MVTLRSLSRFKNERIAVIFVGKMSFKSKFKNTKYALIVFIFGIKVIKKIQIRNIFSTQLKKTNENVENQLAS